MPFFAFCFLLCVYLHLYLMHITVDWYGVQKLALDLWVPVRPTEAIPQVPRSNLYELSPIVSTFF